MAFTRKQYAGGAVSTTLQSGISNADVSIVLVSASGWPDGSQGPFYAVIDQVTVANPSGVEEKILCTSRSSTTLTVSARGVDGTSASSHVAGKTISHCLTATDLDEANYAVAQTVGTVTTAGDLLIGSGANTLQRLANGTTGQPLVAGASAPGYGQLSTAGLADASVTNAKLATSSVSSSNIIDGTIATADIAALAITDALVATANKDGASGTVSMRTLGTGAAQAAAGNDARLSDTRTPTASTITQAMFTAGYRASFEGTSAPSSPANGDLWFDQTNKVWNFYNGTVWITISTVVGAAVATSETTASTSYADLATVGPTLSILTGTSVSVSLYANMANTNAAADVVMTVAITGATTVAAADTNAIYLCTQGAGKGGRIGGTFTITGLTAGTQNITAKYKTNGGTATFSDRRLSAVGIPT